jgi:hypothetical protein
MLIIENQPNEIKYGLLGVPLVSGLTGFVESSEGRSFGCTPRSSHKSRLLRGTCLNTSRSKR